MIGVVKTHEALKMAEEKQVDLVEISPNANPPVAKLLDYDKYRYQQEKSFNKHWTAIYQGIRTKPNGRNDLRDNRT